MSCQSKGTVEIMIESVIAQPEIVIIGKSNIARKLAKIATESDFKVSVLANDIAPEMFPSVNFISEKIDFKSFSNLNNSYIIVTTQGDDDEISVEDDTIVKRMSGRRMHPGSGRNYHVEFNPPKVPDIDDETGEPLVQREDDKPETVKDRLQVYSNQTSPLIEFYSKEIESISYVKVAGSQSPEEVSQAIFDQIELS